MVKISILDLQTSVHHRIGANVRRAREARGISQDRGRKGL
jgi:ribosome-binding protein aMBF1 (putative translation factor)